MVSIFVMGGNSEDNIMKLSKSNEFIKTLADTLNMNEDWNHLDFLTKKPLLQKEDLNGSFIQSVSKLNHALENFLFYFDEEIELRKPDLNLNSESNLNSNRDESINNIKSIPPNANSSINNINQNLASNFNFSDLEKKFFTKFKLNYFMINSNNNENIACRSEKFKLLGKKKSLYSNKKLPHLNDFRIETSDREIYNNKIVRKFKNYLVKNFRNKLINHKTIDTIFWINFIDKKSIPPMIDFTDINDDNKIIEFKSVNSAYLVWLTQKKGFSELYYNFIQDKGENLVKFFIEEYQIKDPRNLSVVVKYLINFHLVYNSPQVDPSNFKYKKDRKRTESNLNQSVEILKNNTKEVPKKTPKNTIRTNASNSNQKSKTSKDNTNEKPKDTSKNNPKIERNEKLTEISKKLFNENDAPSSIKKSIDNSNQQLKANHESGENYSPNLNEKLTKPQFESDLDEMKDFHENGIWKEFGNSYLFNNYYNNEIDHEIMNCRYDLGFNEYISGQICDENTDKN